MELFKLYKYTTQAKHIYYDLGVGMVAEDVSYYEYSVEDKKWQGIYTIKEDIWFDKETDVTPLPLNTLNISEYYKLIKKIFKES